MNWFKSHITILFSVLLYSITLFIATQWRYAEIDEIYFTDAPANLILNGRWMSHILWSQFLYQPLHAFLLIPWMSIVGVSHFSVCGFGVLLGFISCLLLVRYAKRLHYVNTLWQELLIVISFWAFNTFTDYETFGRPDNLGMLVTIIIIDQYLKDPLIRFRKSFLLGILLIWVGVYEVPVMVLFFVFMIILSHRNRIALLKWLKNSVFFGTGIILGELLVCVFFFINKASSVLLYISYTFGMNANSSSSTSLIQRLWEAYSSNWYITVIYAVILIVMLIKHIHFSKPVAIITLLMPALMALAGRYVPYYSWVYYVPICIFLVYSLESFKMLSVSAMAMFVISSIVFFSLQWNYTFGCQTAPINELEVIKHKCNDYFKCNKTLISKYSNVVLSEEQMYYHVINQGVEVWFQYRKHLTHRLEFYNYDSMQKYLTKDERKSDKYLKDPMLGSLVKIYREYNPLLKPFPDEGICIYTCEEEKSTSLHFLEHFGYKYKCLDEEGDFSIYSFSKYPTDK